MFLVSPVIDWLRRRQIRFDRHELSGAFGDIGTDLPLLVGLITVCGLDPSSTLAMFGLMQILSGLWYGLPMPVQPLKAMAVLMIAQRLPARMLYGAGLAAGMMMLVLTLTGLLAWLAGIIPKAVIRGIQLGLGLTLASMAAGKYILADAVPGFLLAGLSFILIIVLRGNKRFPPAIPVILLGTTYAILLKINPVLVLKGVGLSLPRLQAVTIGDVASGFLALALPQLALSISNSVVATNQTIKDLFPESRVGITKIGTTYSLMNLVSPWFSGIPTCHGVGGLAGHYAFGARSGGSVVIYGTMYLMLGLFFAGSFGEVIKVFPLPMLGVILLFEALALMMLASDIAGSPDDLFLALLVALICLTLPHGFVIGLVGGTTLYYLTGRRKITTNEEQRHAP